MQMPLEFSDLIQTLLPKKWSRNQPKGFFFGRKGIWDETGRRWDETGRIGDEWAAGGTNGQQLGPDRKAELGYPRPPWAPRPLIGASKFAPRPIRM